MKNLKIFTNNMSKEIKAPKTAKEMFEELGWKYVKNINDKIMYTNKNDSKWHWDEELLFDLLLKETSIWSIGHIKLTPQLLQAINKQVEELGWNK